MHKNIAIFNLQSAFKLCVCYSYSLYGPMKQTTGITISSPEETSWEGSTRLYLTQLMLLLSYHRRLRMITEALELHLGGGRISHS